jgi:glutaryl-CoA dehydrogenase
LCMFPIWKYGSDEQKSEWLPRMARGEVIGCFGLTEPDAGSDPSAMSTSARRVGGDWVIDGSKAWITNGGVADLAVIWARTSEGVRGFLVPTDTPGFSAHSVYRKASMRASVTSALVLDGVRVPEEMMLPGVASMRGPLSCLTEARLGIVFGVMGAARSCYETALRYASERVQFGVPISSFQLTQAKLVEMMVAIQRGTLLAIRIGRLREEGKLAPEHVSVGKYNNVKDALAVARTARSILGANGITLEYPIMRHMANLETVYTYEGTHEIHTLIVGQALTGVPAFQAARSVGRSWPKMTDESITVAELMERIGSEVGVSDWFTVTQERINAFADATLDHQFIHVDPQRAAVESPFGVTIAHGFFTLSLLPYLGSQVRFVPEGAKVLINYGTEKVRFLTPVLVDSEIRARMELADVTERRPGQYLIKQKVTVDIKGADRPALVAETLTLVITW